MTGESDLVLEVLSGPRDGERVRVQGDADWGRAGGGMLGFPWADRLGEKQARFVRGAHGWTVEPLDAPHGTYRYASGSRGGPERLGAVAKVEAGDVLHAGRTWLRVVRDDAALGALTDQDAASESGGERHGVVGP